MDDTGAVLDPVRPAGVVEWAAAIIVAAEAGYKEPSGEGRPDG